MPYFVRRVALCFVVRQFRSASSSVRLRFVEDLPCFVRQIALCFVACHFRSADLLSRSHNLSYFARQIALPYFVRRVRSSDLPSHSRFAEDLLRFAQDLSHFVARQFRSLDLPFRPCFAGVAVGLRSFPSAWLLPAVASVSCLRRKPLSRECPGRVRQRFPAPKIDAPWQRPHTRQFRPTRCPPPQ